MLKKNYKFKIDNYKFWLSRSNSNERKVCTNDIYLDLKISLFPLLRVKGAEAQKNAFRVTVIFFLVSIAHFLVFRCHF